jgi:hypothetical protein
LGSVPLLKAARCHPIFGAMKMPNFQSWVHWSNRATVKDCLKPGVYLLARFDDKPPAIVDPLGTELIYVGETSKRTLTKRWGEFHGCAYCQKGVHSGGWTFAALFCDNKPGPVHPWLYVTAAPVALTGPHLLAYIAFVERWLIWEHVQRYGKYPPCNKK